jgi:hypothetical protein
MGISTMFVIPQRPNHQITRCAFGFQFPILAIPAILAIRKLEHSACINRQLV